MSHRMNEQKMHYFASLVSPCRWKTRSWIGPQLRGVIQSPPSGFQSLVCLYFGRFPCRCRNFDVTSLRLCWLSLQASRPRSTFSWVRGLEATGFEHSLQDFKIWVPEWLKMQCGPCACSLSLLRERKDYRRERFFSRRVISLSKRVKIQNSLSAHFLWVSPSEIPSSALSLVAIS